MTAKSYDSKTTRGPATLAQILGNFTKVSLESSENVDPEEQQQKERRQRQILELRATAQIPQIGCREIVLSESIA